MSRPCLNQHATRDPKHCEVCFHLGQSGPLGHAFRAFYREAQVEGHSPPPVDSVIPCKFQGPLIPLRDRAKYNLGTLRDYHPCGRGFGDAGIVAPCCGCNPACAGYELPDPSIVADLCSTESS